MIAKYAGQQCATCYRTLAAGTEVGYTRGRIRCAGGCAPISTEDLVAGRARWAEGEARRAARRSDESNPYARHDAANEAWRNGERVGVV